MTRHGWATLLLASFALSGCETTAEKSAKLEKQAKRVAPVTQGLSITHQSTDVRVLGAAVIRGSEGAAAVVTLRSQASRALRDVPIAIAVKDAGGRALFRNNAAGLESALVSVASLAPHASLTWVDDQLPTNGGPTSVSAQVGASPAIAGHLPRLAVDGVRLSEDPTNGTVAAGTVVNHSSVGQRSVVLFAVARRTGHIVAAGRGVVPELPAGASAPFQISFVGDARGAQVHVSVPATTFR